MLYLIGLGLGSEEDITVRGLKAIQTCERVYLEAYTSILMNADIKTLEKFYGKSIIIADRELVEQGSDDILASADVDNVAFLVVGDPFGATTHTDLVLRARELLIPVEVIHNASVMNAVGACGLQLYNFGQTVSLVFFTETWKPDSFYDKIKENRKIGLHTLVLFDIKVKEQSLENLARGRKIYEPPRYMDVATACNQLLEVEDKRQEMAYTPETPCVAVSRLGSTTQKLIAAPLYQLADLTAEDCGPPLHSLVIIGSKRTHELEIDYLEPFTLPDAESFKVAIERDRLVQPVDGKPKLPVDDIESD